ncbi:hypothetical protein NQ317_003119 [Molorchus minor]|uniref:Uncharacterized protein n=1 Tax=Molorchus minor TaxID=1323400 RepID=A0ABQ9JG61_9CUCU|nr:hypothetical protein NQ317_003119 [Molorchus minor]
MNPLTALGKPSRLSPNPYSLLTTGFIQCFVSEYRTNLSPLGRMYLKSDKAGKLTRCQRFLHFYHQSEWCTANSDFVYIWDLGTTLITA